MAGPRYSILEKIDAGGMAEVWKARATSLEGFDKLVAIKRVLPNLTQNKRFMSMFLDEARLALGLNHANVVQTFDIGVSDSAYFLVMEWIDGTQLKQVNEIALLRWLHDPQASSCVRCRRGMQSAHTCAPKTRRVRCAIGHHSSRCVAAKHLAQPGGRSKTCGLWTRESAKPTHGHRSRCREG